ncbi:MAG: Maf family protein [Coriobacteriia bacterium]
MDHPRLLLASASPRRRRLIGWLGLPVSLTAVDTPEDITAPLPPDELASSLAAEKALAARAEGALGTVLALDTIVVLGREVLGKPRDRAHAREMLRRLSGGKHEVVTGVAVMPPEADGPRTFAVSTPVTMRELSEEAVDAWLSGDEALGCAGAYNIERHLASVADDECFNNVAGMPLCHLYHALASGESCGVPEGLVPPVATCDEVLGRRCRLGPVVCGAP